MANHLEQLISEWLEFTKGYIVRRNVKVGRRNRKGMRHGGGHDGELDIVAYDPVNKRILHYEPSIISKTEGEVSVRYTKKFKNGRKYFKEVFPWVSNRTPIEQWAVVLGSCAKAEKLGGGRAVQARKIYEQIAEDLCQRATKTGGWKIAIPENYPLLRTMHFMLRFDIKRTGDKSSKRES